MASSGLLLHVSSFILQTSVALGTLAVLVEDEVWGTGSISVRSKWPPGLAWPSVASRCLPPHVFSFIPRTGVALWVACFYFIPPQTSVALGILAVSVED